MKPAVYIASTRQDNVRTSGICEWSLPGSSGERPQSESSQNSAIHVNDLTVGRVRDQQWGISVGIRDGSRCPSVESVVSLATRLHKLANDNSRCDFQTTRSEECGRAASIITSQITERGVKSRCQRVGHRSLLYVDTFIGEWLRSLNLRAYGSVFI